MNFSTKMRAAGATVATAATAMLASAPAFAGELSDAVQAGVDTTELTAIGVIVLGVAGIILLIRSGRNAAK